MQHKYQDEYYNNIFKAMTSRKLTHKEVKIMTLKALKIHAYIKPIYAIGTTVTYRVRNGYKMGKIIKAFTFKGKWRYVFEGRKDKIQEADIKDIIVLNNQALIKGL